jgi:hypothetical protein
LNIYRPIIFSSTLAEELVAPIICATFLETRMNTGVGRGGSRPVWRKNDEDEKYP